MPLAAAASSSAFAVRRGLPALTGSPAQIEWAEQIRERLVRGLDRQIQSGQGAARTAEFASTRDWMLTHTDARWWIDNRDKKPTTVVRGRYAEIIKIYGEMFGEKKPVRRAPVKLCFLLLVLAASVGIADAQRERIPVQVVPGGEGLGRTTYSDVLRARIQRSAIFRLALRNDPDPVPPYSLHLAATDISQKDVAYNHGFALSVSLTIGDRYLGGWVQVCDATDMEKCARATLDMLLGTGAVLKPGV